MAPGAPAANSRETPAATDLGEGVLQFQSPLWQTNSLLAVARGEALLCDPAFTPAEIDVIAAETGRRAEGGTHLLLTHADFDHTCGIPSFPGAEVVAGEETARKVADGTVAEGLEAAGPEWGVSWPAEGLRVDQVVQPGEEFACGAFRVATVDAPSHGREGLAFVLLDQGILLAADNLSPITYPLLAGPVERAASAYECLLEALAAHRPRWIVPGHGRALTLAEAAEIGEADLAYLDELAAAAREAGAAGLAPGHALLHVYAVEPPRANTDDFDVYGIRAGNARQALADLAD